MAVILFDLESIEHLFYIGSNSFLQLLVVGPLKSISFNNIPMYSALESKTTLPRILGVVYPKGR